MSDESGHLSIGEVLSLVQEEFPDVTISKIRFLESQGLIDPERTPSGYRKFYDGDISRLRWILRQQRDHFLPLKVIKAKLEHPGELDDGPAQPNLWSGSDVEDATTAPGGSVADGARAGSEASDNTTPRGEVADSPAPRREIPENDDRGTDSDSAAWLAALQEAPKRHVSGGLTRSNTLSGAASPSIAEPAPEAAVAAPMGDQGIRFDINEVAELTGVTVSLINELVEFGLVNPVLVGGESTFDATSLEVVRSCARFSEYGLGGRHLRIFKNAADREAGFYEQLILPLLKQRNPKARERATESLGQLVDAGEALHQALVRQALRRHL